MSQAFIPSLPSYSLDSTLSQKSFQNKGTDTTRGLVRCKDVQLVAAAFVRQILMSSLFYFLPHRIWRTHIPALALTVSMATTASWVPWRALMGPAPTVAAVPTTLTEATSASAPQDTPGSTARRRLTTAPPAPAPTVRLMSLKFCRFLSEFLLNPHSLSLQLSDHLFLCSQVPVVWISSTRTYVSVPMVSLAWTVTTPGTSAPCTLAKMVGRARKVLTATHAPVRRDTPAATAAHPSAAVNTILATTAPPATRETTVTSAHVFLVTVAETVSSCFQSTLPSAGRRCPGWLSGPVWPWCCCCWQAAPYLLDFSDQNPSAAVK